MYEEYINKYLVDKNFDEFKRSITGMDKSSILGYVNQEIKRIKSEKENESNSLENLSYDQITGVHDRMMGIEYRYTSLINLRDLLNTEIKRTTL